MRRALTAMLLCTALLLGLVTGAVSAHSLPVTAVAGYQDVTDRCKSLEDIPPALQSKVDQLRLEQGCYDLGYYKGQRYVLAAIGERRTGGYLVELEQAAIIDGTLYLNIAEIAPPGPAIQIITYPYLVLAVDVKFGSVKFWPEDESFEPEKEGTVAATVLDPAKLSDEQRQLVEKLKIDSGGYIIERRDGHSVVLITLGERPTAGYDLTVESVREVDGVLVIDAVEKRPDGLVAQIITYPYVLLYVHGEYSEVRVEFEQQSGAGDPAVEFDTVEKVPDVFGSRISSLRREPGCHDLGWHGKERYVMVALGERPTTGYKVEVKEAVLVGDTLYLSVHEHEPEGPAFEIVTYPYTVIKLSQDFEQVMLAAEESQILYAVLEEADLTAEQRELIAKLKSETGAYVLESQNEYTLVMVACGQRPSAGYTLAVDSLRADGRDLLVNVLETKPTGPVAEVITYPYLVLYVAGEYDQVEVNWLTDTPDKEQYQHVRQLEYRELSRELQRLVEQHKHQAGCYVLEQGEERVILLIAAGTRTSAGYELLLERTQGDDDELKIVVSEQKPGEKAAQVLTYPYLIVEVSSKYEEIKVYLNDDKFEIELDDEDEEQEDRDDDDRNEQDYNYELIRLDELSVKQQQLVKELISRRGAEIIAREDDHTIVLLALGERPSSGYEIEILRVESHGRWLLVDFCEQMPEPGSNVLTMITYPYCLLRVKGSYTAVQMREVAAFWPPGLQKAKAKVPGFLKDKFADKIAEFRMKHRKEAGLTICVNGKELELDFEPVFEQGQLLMPLRQVAEALGALVIWDGRDHSVTIEHDETTIKLYPDTEYALVNGKRHRLELGLRVRQGRSWVPLQVIAELLGVEVEWSADKPLKLKHD